MNGASDLLAAIRAAELEAARRVEEARRAGGQRVEEAREAGRTLLAEARRRGEAAAERRQREAVAAAEAQALEILQGPAASIEALRRRVEPLLAGLAEEMVDLVLAPPAEAGV